MTGRRAGIGIVAAAMLLLLGGTACTADGGLPRPAQLLRNAAAAARATTSAHVTLQLSGAPLTGVSVRAMSADVVRHGDARAKGQLVVPSAFGDARFDFVEIDSTIYTRDASGRFAPAPPQQNGAANPLPTTLIDPHRGVANLLSSMTSVQTEARETVGDVDAFRVTGLVAAHDIAQVVPSVITDGTLTVWFKVGGRHEPVATRLVIGQGEPASQSVLDVRVSDVNRPVHVADPRS
ncbi:LppX_LprAFG lipoprotein [Nocardia sp. NPDC050630]|uniref:LppX_LprAFG lipoprotein n=1 Tax=Nocardia sp. NPDC050630 TaxID=3364321 RepID=UPI00379C15CA